mmetsp:Transcript_5464/g.7078  ORF Transcript_5464/g.7078 Transcript_5464/m.7078 type:complete len:116 (-) Transcript_5464:144-491(-)
MFSRSALAIILAASAAVDANQYLYQPMGPWGLESTIINAKAIRKRDGDLNEVKATSRKAETDKDKKVEEVKNDLDELEAAEEAFHHVAEKVEEVIEHAIDDEVETLFPHHQKTDE